MTHPSHAPDKKTNDAAANDFETIRDRLMKARPSLPPQLRRAAAYLLENPGDVAIFSMRELAASADVPLPNFARLAKEVGFDTYNELRNVYRRRVQDGGRLGYPERAAKLQDSVDSYGADAVWEAFRNAAFECVKSVFDQVDAALVSSVAKELSRREHIYVVGMQASESFSKYLHYIGGMVSPVMRAVGRSGGILADDLVDLNNRDAVICVSLRPCARSTIEVAALARERNAYIVGITDSRTSPLAAVSDEVLLTSTESPSFFQSNIGTTAIVEMLVGYFMTGEDRDGIERISKIETDRRRFNEYWNEKGAT